MKLTKKRLRAVLWYDPKTGDFLWRSHGRVAGTNVHNGGGIWYRRVKIDGENYYAHRLVWLYTHGRWPINQIDHINGDGLDNALSNLRDTTPQINRQNHHRRNPTARNLPVGIGYSKGRKAGAYTAKIGLLGKRVYLGRFDTAEDASAAYQKAKSEHMGKLLGRLV